MSYLESHVLSVSKAVSFLKNHNLENYSISESPHSKNTRIVFVNKTGFFGRIYHLILGPTKEQVSGAALRILKGIKTHKPHHAEDFAQEVRRYAKENGDAKKYKKVKEAANKINHSASKTVKKDELSDSEASEKPKRKHVKSGKKDVSSDSEASEKPRKSKHVKFGSKVKVNSKVVRESAVKKKEASKDLKRIMAFFKAKQPNHNGETWDEIYAYDHSKYGKGPMETNHHYIQSVFPTCEMGVDKKAPILKNLTHDEHWTLIRDPKVRRKIELFFNKMMEYYGIDLKRMGYKKAVVAQWIKTHDVRRISRILTTLDFFGFNRERRDLIITLKDISIKNPGKVSAATAKHWHLDEV